MFWQLFFGSSQKRAFQGVKNSVSSDEVLVSYDVSRETVLLVDTSSYGLRAVLQQKQLNSELQPVAYISRALTPTEQHYAQLEREAFGITWACGCIQNYLLGKTLRLRQTTNLWSLQTNCHSESKSSKQTFGPFLGQLYNCFCHYCSSKHCNASTIYATLQLHLL